MPDEPDEIVRLPVQPRPSLDEGAYLRPVPHTSCQHYDAPFEVDVDAGSCRCLRCGGTVTPIFVLEQLMKAESGWRRTREAYQDEMRRLAERSRTKCERCGHLTRISGR
jgi:hypothetical protein